MAEKGSFNQELEIYDVDTNFCALWTRVGQLAVEQGLVEAWPARCPSICNCNGTSCAELQRLEDNPNFLTLRLRKNGPIEATIGLERFYSRLEQTLELIQSNGDNSRA